VAGVSFEEKECRWGEGKRALSQRPRAFPMLVRLLKDQIVNQSPTCGEVREVLFGDQYPYGG